MKKNNKNQPKKEKQPKKKNTINIRAYQIEGNSYDIKIVKRGRKHKVMYNGVEYDKIKLGSTIQLVREDTSSVVCLGYEGAIAKVEISEEEYNRLMGLETVRNILSMPNEAQIKLINGKYVITFRSEDLKKPGETLARPQPPIKPIDHSYESDSPSKIHARTMVKITS